MLNGKFYTGLPPKMIERSGGTVQNRQQSHFFWPDDTKTESAVETRIRRRNSLDTTTTTATIKPTKLYEKPQKVYETVPENEVDTRQMFKKEFANSSIKFFDNLQDEQSTKGYTLRTARDRKQELTPKLTSTKVELPKEQTVNEAYTTAKRKQAYSSKIEFYDFVNEQEPTPNNTRKPKMDMNDKREVERNTKNSPKLQVKRNVRNFSLDRELYAPVKQSESVKSVKPQRPQLQLNLSKPQNISTTDIYDLEMTTQRHVEPKKILKNANSTPSYSNENYNDYRVAADYLDGGLRQLRLRSTTLPKKHVTYSDEAYEQDLYDTRRQLPTRLLRPLRQIRTFYDDFDDMNGTDISGYEGELVRRPNMRTGNGNRQQQQQQQQRQQLEEQLEPQIRQYMETGSELKTINKNNNNNDYDYDNTSNRSNNYGNNMASHRKKVNSQTLTSQIKSEKSSAAVAAPTLGTKDSRAKSVEPFTSPLSPTDPLKHLRSSLCFNGDALIVASNATETPTSETRRKARSSAGSQRISVGLPD